MKTPKHFLILLLSIAILTVLSACSPVPTPYQPKLNDYGYEESRLQENVYRVSFKANRYTDETEVLDYLYLRSAELTKEAGFTHFVVVQEFGKSQTEQAPRSGISIGMGFFSGSRRSMFGAGFTAPLGSSDTQTSVKYHLGVLIIRMLTAEQAKNEKDAVEVNYLINSVQKKLRKEKLEMQ